MDYLATEQCGTEFIFNMKPERGHDGILGRWNSPSGVKYRLPFGSIQKLTGGRIIRWEDEPVEYE